MNYEKGDTVIGSPATFESDSIALVNELVNKTVQLIERSQQIIEHLDQDSLRKIMDSTFNNSFPEYRKNK